MEWLTRYFNNYKNKYTNENLLLAHIKETYDFDSVTSIKKNDKNFLSTLDFIATDIFQKNNYNNPHQSIDSDCIKHFVLNLNNNPDLFIIRMIRNYQTSQYYEHALCFKSKEKYVILHDYISNSKIFGNFPKFDPFVDGYLEVLEKTKSYQCILDNNTFIFKPTYSFKFPVDEKGLLLRYDVFSSKLHENKDNCFRDLELIVEVNQKNKDVYYTVKLFYKDILLREDQNQQFLDFNRYLEKFLFPYNLDYELICEIGLSFPFEFTPEFLARLNPDVKTTIDMLQV